MPINNNQIEDKARPLTEDPSPPNPGPNRGSYFVKDVSGVAEAFYKDDQSREIQLTDNGVATGAGGGGSSTVDGLTDTDLTSPANGEFLKFDGTNWINAVLAGGGDLLAANNLSDISNAATALSNLGGEPELTGGAGTQYFKGDKSLGTFATDVASAASVAANTSKVSADGSIATHSNVDLTGISTNDFLQWNGTNFTPVSLPGGGDLLSTNNLSDIDNAATALANLSGLDATNIVSQVDAEAGVDTVAKVWTAERVKQAIDALGGSGSGDLLAANNLNDVANAATALTNLGAQADLDVPSQAEAEAGTATTERVWTAERIKQAIDALASGGSSDDFKIQLGAGATIADKITAAPVGGIPAGWTILDGDDGGVHAQLSGSDQDLIIQHSTGKIATIVGAVSVSGFGGWSSLNFSAAGDLKTEDATRNQTRITAFNTAAGSLASIITIKLIDFIV